MFGARATSSVVQLPVSRTLITSSCTSLIPSLLLMRLPFLTNNASCVFVARIFFPLQTLAELNLVRICDLHFSVLNQSQFTM